MNNPKIRDAWLTDSHEIFQMEQASFADGWSENLIFQELLTQGNNYLVLEQDEKLIGYAGVQNVVGQGHITTICVSQPFRGKGYGSLLLKELILRARQAGMLDITLEVRASNQAAIDLYQSLGFQHYGVRKAYYQDNREDAHIMWLIQSDDQSEHV